MCPVDFDRTLQQNWLQHVAGTRSVMVRNARRRNATVQLSRILLYVRSWCKSKHTYTYSRTICGIVINSYVPRSRQQRDNNNKNGDDESVNPHRAQFRYKLRIIFAYIHISMYLRTCKAYVLNRIFIQDVETWWVCLFAQSFFSTRNSIPET